MEASESQQQPSDPDQPSEDSTRAGQEDGQPHAAIDASSVALQLQHAKPALQRVTHRWELQCMWHATTRKAVPRYWLLDTCIPGGLQGVVEHLAAATASQHGSSSADSCPARWHCTILSPGAQDHHYMYTADGGVLQAAYGVEQGSAPSAA